LIRAGLITSKWTIRIGGVIYTVAALAKKIGVILVGVNDKTQLTVEQKKQPISEIKKSGEDVREEIRDKAIDEIEETDSTQKQMDIVKINIKYTTNQDSINAYHGIY
jgi:predicted HTH transcriptional regulator